MSIFHKYKKIIAFILITIIVSDLISPLATYASGPVTPEVTGFEPIEVADMVDLSTGDLTYNKLLLEVPGISGGFPISMSYHAGIYPEQEASWVGLGWSLNPGAITRTKVGYPDDWKNVTEYSRQHWVGGSTMGVGVAFNIPLSPDAGIIGPSLIAGMSFAKDTYRGKAYGGTAGIGLSILSGIGVSGSSVAFSSNRISGNSISISSSIGLSIPSSNSNLPGQANLGVSGRVNFTGSGGSAKSGISAGFSSGDFAARDYNTLSIGTNGASISSSTFGHNIQSNIGKGIKTNFQRSGALSVQSVSMTMTGALTFFYSRYKINEVQNTSVNGAMHPATGTHDLNYFDDHAFDIYDEFEFEDVNNTIDEESVPRYELGNEMLMGGTFPSYDGYMLTGQGIGGAIQPVNYLTTLKRQNKMNKDSVYTVKQYVDTSQGIETNSSSESTEFTFIGGFSNKYLYDTDNSQSFGSSSTIPLSYDFLGTEIESSPGIGENSNAVIKPKFVKAIKTAQFTLQNNQPSNSPEGLMNIELPNIPRSVEDEKIGGFLAVNESGMKYHYALPAHILNEESRQINVYSAAKNPNNSDKWITNTTVNGEKYAYTWHLTGITGPDYVDRGGGANGSDPNYIIDESDWGYWVKFEYGLWESDYKWRSPEKGFYENYDGNFKSFSKGTKEVYYLNKIVTPTHTALFIKDIRQDGHGLADFSGYNDSFDPVGCSKYPALLLKLSEIVVVRNEHLLPFDYSYNNKGQNENWCTYNFPSPTSGCLLGENITSTQRDLLDQNMVKSVKFNTDYQLMPGSPSSFSNENIYTSNPVSPTVFTGKLTLKGIQYIGRNGSQLIPSEKFSYKNPNTPYCKDCMDYWGYYKSDYNPNIKEVNLRHMPTSQSASQVDSWSLDKITSSLGGETVIKYESDDFSQSVLSDKISVQISDCIRNSSMPSGRFKLYFDGLGTSDIDLMFNNGDPISFTTIVSIADYDKYDGICGDVYRFWLGDIKYYFNEGTITNVSSDHIEVQATSGDYVIHDLPYELFNGSDGPNHPGQHCSSCGFTGGWQKDWKDFIAGEIYFDLKDKGIGGGLRVKSVSATSSIDFKSHAYNYEYTVGSTSSGVTPYIPVSLNPLDEIDFPQKYKDQNGFYKSGEICNGSAWKTVVDLIKSKPYAFFNPVLFYVSAKNYVEALESKESLTLLTPTDEDYIKFKRKSILGDEIVKRGMTSPGVIYSQVKSYETFTDKEGSVRSEGYSVFEFQPFKSNMVDVKTIQPKTEQVKNDYYYGDAYRKIKKRGVQLSSFFGSVGALKSVTAHDSGGKPLIKTSYLSVSDKVSQSGSFLDNYESYLEDHYGSQGVYDEVFVSARQVPYQERIDNGMYFYDFDILGVLSKRRSYPDIPLVTESIDYRTGISTHTYNLEFDFYTGAVVKSLNRTASKDQYVTQITPAYKVLGTNGSAYAYMNSRYLGDSYKNMLTQDGISLTFKVFDDYDPETDGSFVDNIEGLTSGSVQTWSKTVPLLYDNEILEQNISGVYSKQSSFTFIGDDVTEAINGVYPITYSGAGSISALGLSYSNEPNQSGWQKNSEITLLDVYSNPLEVKDRNDIFASTKYDNSHSRVFATALNAQYEEFAYTGGEDWNGDDFGGQVIRNSSSVLSFKDNGYPTHSGDKSFGLTAGIKGVGFATENLTSGRTYIVNFWSTNPYCELKYIYNDNGVELGSETETLGQVGIWYLIQATVPTGTSTTGLEVYCKGPSGASLFQVDDFRFQPLDGATIAYVYNAWGGLSHILNNDNIYTKFEYDDMGRLTSVFSETLQYGIVKLNEREIHYSNQD